MCQEFLLLWLLHLITDVIMYLVTIIPQLKHMIIDTVLDTSLTQEGTSHNDNYLLSVVIYVHDLGT
jgi:hypothetical protein